MTSHDEQSMRNTADIARIGAELKGAVDKMNEAADRLEKNQTLLQEHLDALRSEVQHYKGIVGGIAFVFSGMFTVLVAFKGWLFGADR
jgi:hypothetical protein